MVNFYIKKNKKVSNTRTSKVVTHPSTTQARKRRSDEIRYFHLSMVVVNEFIFSNILFRNINLLHQKKDYNAWTS